MLSPDRYLVTRLCDLVDYVTFSSIDSSIANYYTNALNIVYLKNLI